MYNTYKPSIANLNWRIVNAILGKICQKKGKKMYKRFDYKLFVIENIEAEFKTSGNSNQVDMVNGKNGKNGKNG